MNDVVKAQVISYPEVKNKEVIFFCEVNKKVYCCIAKKDDRIKTLIFIKPGQIIEIAGMHQAICIRINDTTQTFIYLKDIKIELETENG